MTVTNSQLMPAAECIYCGATEELTREHIIPYGLGGTLTLPNGSCKTCAAITSAFEGQVLRGFMLDARTAGRLPTRRPQKRSPEVAHSLLDKGGRVKGVNVPVGDAVGAALMPTFARASRVDGRPYGPGIVINGTRMITFGGDLETLIKKHGAKGIRVQQTVEWSEFARMLAKIGYSYYVAAVGQPPRDEVPVLPLILQGRDDPGAWVGSRPREDHLPSGTGGHWLAFDEMRSGEHVIHSVYVALFADTMDIGYEVIVWDPLWKRYVADPATNKTDEA